MYKIRNASLFNLYCMLCSTFATALVFIVTARALSVIKFEPGGMSSLYIVTARAFGVIKYEPGVCHFYI